MDVDTVISLADSLPVPASCSEQLQNESIIAAAAKIKVPFFIFLSLRDKLLFCSYSHYIILLFTLAKIMKKDKTVVMKVWFLCPLDTKKVSTFWQVDTFL